MNRSKIMLQQYRDQGLQISVSILVLLDESLEAASPVSAGPGPSVSILVLLDESLEGARTMHGHADISGFNPCSLG